MWHKSDPMGLYCSPGYRNFYDQKLPFKQERDFK